MGYINLIVIFSLYELHGIYMYIYGDTSVIHNYAEHNISQYTYRQIIFRKLILITCLYDLILIEFMTNNGQRLRHA